MNEFPWAFLNDCQNVLSNDCERGMEPKIPEEAVAYGKELLAAAGAAENAGGARKQRVPFYRA